MCTHIYTYVYICISIHISIYRQWQQPWQQPPQQRYNGHKSTQRWWIGDDAPVGDDYQFDGDDMMGSDRYEDDDEDDVRAEKPDKQSIDSVLEWLKHKGADPGILEQIDQLKQKEEEEAKQAVPQPATIKELQAKHQSALARLANNKEKIDKIDYKIDKTQRLLDELHSEKDDLSAKRDQINAELEQLNNTVTSPLAEKVQQCDQVIKELQELVKEGIPDDAASKRKIYDLLFSGKPSMSSESIPQEPPSGDLQGAHNGLQQIPIVLGKGSGFGPNVSVPARSGTPYSTKVPAAGVPDSRDDGAKA